MAANENLLLVDDEEVNRDMLSRRLQRNGFTVEVAESGAQAIAHVEQRATDLVLLDTMMPGMSGIDVLRELRVRHTREQLPIIMVTAVADSPRIAEALDLGANDYVTKPVDFQVALARIRAQLARKHAGSELRSSEERYALAMRGSSDGLWDWSVDTGKIYFSPRWKSMLGYAEDEIGSDPEEWFSRVHTEDIQALRQALDDHWNGRTEAFKCEYRVRHKSGACLWMLGRGLGVRSSMGQPVRMAGSQSDITALKTVDALTGLPNRALFTELVGASLERMRREPGRGFAVLYLDLDRFKLINDSMGHLAGDRLLAALAGRLRTVVERAGDRIARMGGDQFAMLVDGATALDRTAEAAGRILAAMRRPFMVEGRSVFCSATMGVAPAGPHYASPEEIVRDADTAMHAAKARGKARWVVFEAGMRDQVTARLEMETDLETALEREQFAVYYQPRVELSSASIRGFEALVRWMHPARGIVPPDAFIPVAEETGHIHAMGLWVLRQACLQAKEWQARFPQEPPLGMAVNVSPVQCREPDFVQRVAAVLEETGVDPATVHLEITESVLLENLEEAEQILTALKKLGVGLKLDDFGTGYSCLKYLARLPFDMLKIDRSFTMALDEGDGENEALVRTIMSMAHNLKLGVVAEGVETKEHARRLEEMGCEFGQGYLYSRPLDSAATEALLVQAAAATVSPIR